jgi:hypothetical protein
MAKWWSGWNKSATNNIASIEQPDLLPKWFDSMLKCKRKLVALEVSAAANVDLTPNDLRGIESAALKITVLGARYPEILEAITGT